MVTRLCRVSVAASLLSVVAFSAYAQEPSSQASAPAHLSFVDGDVEVVQDGVSDRAEPPVLLIESDQVRTRNGRAEIIFSDGTLLHLSHDAELEVLGSDHLRLTTGRLILRLSHAAPRPYVIDTPAASVRLEAEGEYGISTDRGARLDVTVTRGTALVSDATSWEVRGGQRLTAAGLGARPLIASFNTARWDAFAQWSSDRANRVAASSSAAQLPYQLRQYAPLMDQYGRWHYMVPHGYVWVPAVGAGWRPYYDGSWSFTRYGWTWRGHERWAWPTHHYGRWGFTGAVWYWVPATIWAPAWVSWSLAPGYVGWAPIGWHGNLGGGAWPGRDHPAYTPHYNPWRGWTVVRRDHFAPRRHVRVHAVDGERLDDTTRRTLMAQASAVVRTKDTAVSRESVSIIGSRGSVRRPPQVGSVEVPSALGADHPGYAPPASWNSSDRRGAVRDPRLVAPRTPSVTPSDPSRHEPSRPARVSPRGAPRDSSRREPSQPPPISPRAAPRGEGANDGQAAQPRGAVGRGDSARTPSSRVVPVPGTRAPAPSSSKPSSQGGARRRPGA